MIKIGSKTIGAKNSPFIIAEMSGNHNQSLDRALSIVDAAADAGADAIKLQTYTADTMTLDIKKGDFFIDDPKSLWKGQSMHDLYKLAYTPWDWHKPIIEHARSKDLLCFSTPFDETAVDFLESLEVPAYKIASFECIDLPLIKKVASTKKPLIISTGMATKVEITEAVDAARSVGCKDLILLKCTSTYPASPKNTNLNTISHMRKLFNCEVGLSDHTLGIGAAVAAVAVGASVIEKHFTLSRADGGVDSAFSLEPSELSSLVSETKRAFQALGDISYGATEAEKSSRSRRRSLYIGENMKAGEVLTAKNLRRIRPGNGLLPKYYEKLLGKKIKFDTPKGTPVSWDLILED
jgi:pseudaminic acid synthase